MSSPGFQSDAAAMTRAVQSFEETASNARKAMADLESDLQGTLHQYAGDQATAFWNLHTTLQADMQKANQELDVMSNLVNQSFHNYNTGDAQVADTLRSVNNTAQSGGAVFNRLVGGH